MLWKTHPRSSASICGFFSSSPCLPLTPSPHHRTSPHQQERIQSAIMAKQDRDYKKRVVFRIQLTTEAKKGLTNLSDQRGIPQISLTSRLVEWFASQDLSMQGAILGLYPEKILPDVAKIILDKKEK